MRAAILIIIAACCCLSCKKSSPISPGLFGKWELRRMYGGFLGIDSAYKPGNGTIYQFNSDSTYKYFVKGKLNSQGIYHYRKNGYAAGGNTFYDALVLDNVSYGEMAVLSGTKLTIGNNWADGIAVEYAKISDR